LESLVISRIEQVGFLKIMVQFIPRRRAAEYSVTLLKKAWQNYGLRR
jgi:hypothetical protein